MDTERRRVACHREPLTTGLLGLGMFLLGAIVSGMGHRLEVAVAFIVATTIILLWRTRLHTELFTYGMWVAVIASIFVSRAAIQFLDDYADWETSWRTGMMMLLVIPTAATVLVWLLRRQLEPAVTRCSRTRQRAGVGNPS